MPEGHHHSAPWARLPLLGDFEDWRDIARLGLRADFHDSQGQWKSVYSTKQVKTWSDQDILGAYVDALATSISLQGIIYTSLSPWRKSVLPIRAVEIRWQNLTQTMQLCELQNHRVVSKSKLQESADVRKEFESLGKSIDV